jgi:anti-sigma factor RsiW
MNHAEILSSMPEHLAGKGSPQQRAQVQAHLADCGPCRRIAQAWPQGAEANLLPAVLEGLRPAQGREMRLGWAMPAAAALSLALLAGAFWHPERAWVRADKAFADLGAPRAASLWKGELR